MKSYFKNAHAKYVINHDGNNNGFFIDHSLPMPQKDGKLFAQNFDKIIKLIEKSKPQLVSANNKGHGCQSKLWELNYTFDASKTCSDKWGNGRYPSSQKIKTLDQILSSPYPQECYHKEEELAFGIIAYAFEVWSQDPGENPCANVADSYFAFEEVTYYAWDRFNSVACSETERAKYIHDLAICSPGRYGIDSWLAVAQMEKKILLVSTQNQRYKFPSYYNEKEKFGVFEIRTFVENNLHRHEKLGVEYGDNKETVCFGDSNRVRGQLHHLGAIFCFNDLVFAKELRKMAMGNFFNLEAINTQSLPEGIKDNNAAIDKDIDDEDADVDDILDSQPNGPSFYRGNVYLKSIPKIGSKECEVLPLKEEEIQERKADRKKMIRDMEKIQTNTDLPLYKTIIKENASEQLDKYPFGADVATRMEWLRNLNKMMENRALKNFKATYDALKKKGGNTRFLQYYYSDTLQAFKAFNAKGENIKQKYLQNYKIPKDFDVETFLERLEEHNSNPIPEAFPDKLFEQVNSAYGMNLPSPQSPLKKLIDSVKSKLSPSTKTSGQTASSPWKKLSQVFSPRKTTSQKTQYNSGDSEDDGDTIIPIDLNHQQSCSYYNIPLVDLFKSNRFDIFDHRWSKSTYNKNSDKRNESTVRELIDAARSLDVDHLFDIQYTDVIEFFKYNQCVHRLNRVWRSFYRIFRDDGFQRQEDMDSVLGTLIKYRLETDVREFRHYLYKKEIVSDVYHQYKHIAKQVGSTGCIEVYKFSCTVVEKIDNIFWSNPLCFYEYHCMVEAVKASHLNLFYYIFKQLKLTNPWFFNTNCGFTFNLTDFNCQEIILFLLDKENIINENLYVSCFPYESFNMAYKDIVLPIAKRNKNIAYSFDKAYEIGDLDLLKLMYEHFPDGANKPFSIKGISSLHVLEFFFTKHTAPWIELERIGSGSVEFAKYLVEKQAFIFTGEIFANTSIRVIEYFINDLKVKPKLVSEPILDIQVFQLLYKTFGTQFVILGRWFLNLLENHNPSIELVAYLLSNQPSLAQSPDILICCKDLKLYRFVLNYLMQGQEPKHIFTFPMSIPCSLPFIERAKEIYGPKCLLQEFNIELNKLLLDDFDMSSRIRIRNILLDDYTIPQDQPTLQRDLSDLKELLCESWSEGDVHLGEIAIKLLHRFKKSGFSIDPFDYSKFIANGIYHKSLYQLVHLYPDDVWNQTLFLQQMCLPKNTPIFLHYLSYQITHSPSTLPRLIDALQSSNKQYYLNLISNLNQSIK
ncbi:hypothetical protein CYY_000088 [Polysphondylium violaceum]|uniref:Uncharacterized protein n=1 Tax=Polysphondylium violaceum TaxID=133409 RepID=A0A8J4Q0B9_9MYCE|nr:hypothetical protein CYY_000088 [Polysphondylium violaceum]